MTLKRQVSVSIRMVAERAGVSTATVSNVLTGKTSVSVAYADRVRAAAEALGYVPDSHASRLRSGRHSLAGVIVPDLSNPVFGAFVSTLERLARSDGFDLLVASADNDPALEADRLRTMRSWRPAGLIVIPTDGALAARLPAVGVPPIVVADRVPDDEAFDLIAVDNACAAGAVTGHLQAQGFGACLVVCSALSISNIRERWEGAVAGARTMSITAAELGFAPDDMRRRLADRLDSGPRPDVLFALDQVTALAAYELLADRGITIPTDLGFASFDEAEWMRLVSPAITAVRQPFTAMAEAAWSRLRERLAGTDNAVRRVRLSCEVAMRGSTLRHPAGR